MACLLALVILKIAKCADSGLELTPCIYQGSWVLSDYAFLRIRSNTSVQGVSLIASLTRFVHGCHTCIRLCTAVIHVSEADSTDTGSADDPPPVTK